MDWLVSIASLINVVALLHCIICLAFKTVNLKLTTPDKVNIGAWYVLSEPAYKAIGGNTRSSPPTPEDISRSLKDHPTVLFFHGNAANRAIQYRVQMYGSVSAQLGELGDERLCYRVTVLILWSNSALQVRMS